MTDGITYRDAHCTEPPDPGGSRAPASLVRRIALILALFFQISIQASTASAADHQGIDELLGDWTLTVSMEQLSGGPIRTTEILSMRREGNVLVATLTLASGVRPVSDLAYRDGTLTFTAPTRAPGATEPLSPRAQRMIGPTLHYEATVHNGYLEGFKRAYFGAAEFTGVMAGSNITPERIAAPAFEATRTDGETFTFLREETFSIGGQEHTVRIYRSNLFAAVLGLGPEESDIAAEFVLVPDGRFLMGTTAETRAQMKGTFATADLMKDEGPQREVRIESFLLARTELTQKLWRGLAHLSGLPRNPSLFQHGGDYAPVEQISWNQSQLWLIGVNDSYDLDLRLPSEAEWEYAARAGTTTPLYNGKFPGSARRTPTVDEIAWYLGNSSAGYPVPQNPARSIGPHPVGEKTPNAFGVYDILGNVYEWVADIAHGSYVGAPTDGRPWRGGETVSGTLLNGPAPQGPLISARDHTYVPGRIRRGGSWRNWPYNVRAGVRAYRGPNFTDGNNGIRVASDVPFGLEQ